MLPKTPVIRDAGTPVDDSPVSVAVDVHAREAFGDALMCPRCGYNLRGLTGDRCPECGLTLDWAAIIASAQRRVDLPIFEYQCRTRPIRSFLGTLRLTLQPLVIWRLIPLTATPRPQALLLFVFLTLPFYMTASLLLEALHRAGEFAFYYLRGYRSRYSFSLFYSQYDFHQFLELNLGRYAVLLGIGVIAGLMLSIFHRSLLGHSVRRVHLLRIGVYVFGCLVTVHLVNATLRTLLTTAYAFTPNFFLPLWGPALAVLDVVFLALPTWSIARAARDYLAVRRPWQFAIVVLVMTYLICFTIFVVYAVVVDTFDNTLAWIDSDTWPGIDYIGAWIPQLLGIQ